MNNEQNEQDLKSDANAGDTGAEAMMAAPDQTAADSETPTRRRRTTTRRTRSAGAGRSAEPGMEDGTADDGAAPDGVPGGVPGAAVASQEAAVTDEGATAPKPRRTRRKTAAAADAIEAGAHVDGVAPEAGAAGGATAAAGDAAEGGAAPVKSRARTARTTRTARSARAADAAHAAAGSDDALAGTDGTASTKAAAEGAQAGSSAAGKAGKTRRTASRGASASSAVPEPQASGVSAPDAAEGPAASGTSGTRRTTRRKAAASQGASAAVAAGDTETVDTGASAQAVLDLPDDADARDDAPLPEAGLDALAAGQRRQDAGARTQADREADVTDTDTDEDYDVPPVYDAPSVRSRTFAQDDGDDDDWDDARDAWDEDEDDDFDDGPADEDPVPFFARQAPIGLKGGRRGESVPGAEKLHKILADAGIGSRRDMEELIIAGRVSVNGMPAHVGQRVGPEDVIRVNGKPLARKRAAASQVPQVLLYHKPTGELVTRDDPGSRPKVFDRLPRLRGARWIAVGRLDLNSEGLLIFTTSGDLANRLMHPRYGWEREYAVRVLGRVDEAMREQLLSGVMLEDGPATLQSIEDIGGDDDGANHWYRVVILEGRNREVRRLFDAVGLTVSRLVRIRFGPIALPPRLKRGKLQALGESEVRQLQQQIRKHTADVGRDAGAEAAPAPSRGRGRQAGAGRRAGAREGAVPAAAGNRAPRGAGARGGVRGQGAMPRGAAAQGAGFDASAGGLAASREQAGMPPGQEGQGGPQPAGSRHPARRRLLRGRKRNAQPVGSAGQGAAFGADQPLTPDRPRGQEPGQGDALPSSGQARRTRGGRRNRPAEGAGASQPQARNRRGGRRQAGEGMEAMGAAGEGPVRQPRGKRSQGRQDRNRASANGRSEALGAAPVRMLEPTAEKKTLTVSERRGWTETRYLPQAVSYSGDTDWSKVGRETVLPDRSSRPRRVKERNGNVAPRVRARPAPAGRRVNYEDDDWQPTSDSAHLEGITRSLKRDERQQRWGGTPGFAARLGQPFDPNAGSGWTGQRQPDNGPRQPRGKRSGAGLGGNAAGRPRRNKGFKAR